MQSFVGNFKDQQEYLVASKEGQVLVIKENFKASDSLFGQTKIEQKRKQFIFIIRVIIVE